MTLYTTDIMNIHFNDMFDNSDNHYVYIHKNPNTKARGLLYFEIYGFHLCFGYCVHTLFPPTVIENSKREVRQDHSNFIQGCSKVRQHGTSYQTFMTKINDHLITLQYKDWDFPDTHDDLSINTPDSQTMEPSVASHNVVKSSNVSNYTEQTMR